MLNGFAICHGGITATITFDLNDVNDDGTITARKAIMGALTLYLDFINLFLFMLRLIGDRR